MVNEQNEKFESLIQGEINAIIMDNVMYKAKNGNICVYDIDENGEAIPSILEVLKNLSSELAYEASETGLLVYEINRATSTGSGMVAFIERIEKSDYLRYKWEEDGKIFMYVVDEDGNIVFPESSSSYNYDMIYSEIESDCPFSNHFFSWGPWNVQTLGSDFWNCWTIREWREQRCSVCGAYGGMEHKTTSQSHTFVPISSTYERCTRCGLVRSTI